MHPSLRDSVDYDMTSQSSPLLSLGDLACLCETSWGLERYSPLSDHKYLLLDVRGVLPAPGSTDVNTLVNRLRQLPCPVIAVGDMNSPLLLRGVDVLVPRVQAAATVIRNINQHPLAAMTLVQLLRYNEDASSVQGLFAESLAYASLQQGAEFAQVIKKVEKPVVVAPGSDSVVLVERTDDELRITLNRPQARNAYSTAMRDGLYDALQILKMDKQLLRAVISGQGSCFCIGGDLNEFGRVSDPSTAHAIRSSRSVAHELLELSSRLEFRLHSACIGAGIELPAFGGRVVAEKNAFMKLPEITLGLLPGAGGTVSILARIGRQRTAYLALSARRISASTALQWGLIDEIV